MTREGNLFTNSQEEALLHEYAAMKDLAGHIDLQFQLPFDNFSQFIEETNPNHCEYEVDPNYRIDDKIALQQTISMYHQAPTPTPILGKEEYAGRYNFQLILNHQNSGKHWVYSEKLSKVFIHMEEVLPLQFQWTPPRDGLWVRATLVYKLDQHRSQPVIRCHNHMAPDNISNRNISPKQTKHVIRCLHNTSSYEEASNGHLSVLTPLGMPEAGVFNVPMDFKFYCKNSCTSGMNRRPTELIFTLEDDQNTILGRRKLEVRVCSCPKRDKEKEESEMVVQKQGTGKKRKSTTQMVGPPPPPPSPPPGKKVIDNQIIPLNINVLGQENAIAVLKYAYDVMAGSALRAGNIEPYQPLLEDLSRQIQ